MTPEEYTERNVANSKSSSINHFHIGQSYTALANFFRPPRTVFNHTIIPREPPPSPEPFVVLHDLRSKSVLQFDTDEGIDSFQSFAVDKNHNPVLFMRGYPSPTWLEVIGAKYMVDPELFQRHLHLESLASRNHYVHPSLPSTRTNIFDLCITTIVSKDTYNLVTSLRMSKIYIRRRRKPLRSITETLKR